MCRGAGQAILARPISAGRGLCAAGALYPAALTAEEGAAGRAAGSPPARAGPFGLPALFGPAEELALDWQGGYAAEVGQRLVTAGLDPSRFDLARLRSEAAVRVADPWSALAPAEVARRLAAGSFRADALRERKRWLVLLPGPGPWAPESPLAAAPVAAAPSILASADPSPAGADTAGASAWRAELPEGVHRFLGREAELIVSVDAEGGSAWVRVPASPRGSPGS